MVGNVADNIRYAKEGKDAILGSRVADAAVRSGQTIFSSSMLSGLANAMDFFQDPRTSPDKINRFLAATGTSLVVPSGLKQLDMELAPTQHSDNGPLGVEGAALPIVRREGTVRSDNLGQ